jgi:hypothetical protein
MVKVIISDFSRVLLFPVDKGYLGSLNSLNNELLKSDSNYDFTHHFTLNIELLCYYQTLGMPVYIFTSVRIQETQVKVCRRSLFEKGFHATTSDCQYWSLAFGLFDLVVLDNHDRLGVGVRYEGVEFKLIHDSSRYRNQL